MRKEMSQRLLCINVDHIATVRQARGGIAPDPVEGARICEESGADGITVHLREDRRHIQDNDVVALKDVVRGKYNLEMALSEEIIEIALNICPNQVTLVPEKREELTTEGGLNVEKYFNEVKRAVDRFHEKNITVSLFVEPDRKIIDLSKDSGSDYIEIHTGRYCDSSNAEEMEMERKRIIEAAQHAVDTGLRVNAGHGLNYRNTYGILEAPGLEELNIGHSIIARSIMVGLPQAVKEMLAIIR
jgi:pyridoxine 5-phosphate synthase